MQNYSTVLDQTTWGIHLNSEGHFASPPNAPSWLTQLQQQDWQQRGIVLWNADHRIVVHLDPGYMHELLEHLQGNDTWKTKGLVIGSPTFRLSANGVSTPSTKVGGDWVMKNQIDLGYPKIILISHSEERSDEESLIYQEDSKWEERFFAPVGRSHRPEAVSLRENDMVTVIFRIDS